jgi:hypothetical protein
LLLEQEILRDHRAHATVATHPRGYDGRVKQGEQEVLHARTSVGQTSGATQRCRNLGFSERMRNSRPQACSKYQDEKLRSLSAKRVQCDEIWSFVGSKEKNTTADKKAEGCGDCWTRTALDSDTKLIMSGRLRKSLTCWTRRKGQ